MHLQFFAEVYALMHGGSPEQTVLAFCLLASGFERTLGDVYASRTGCNEDDIPHKLNELLVATDVIQVIGADKVVHCRSYLGAAVCGSLHRD